MPFGYDQGEETSLRPEGLLKGQTWGQKGRFLVLARNNRGTSRLSPSFQSPSFQATLNQFARLCIQHRNLLVARMQITPYNLHVLGSFPPSLGCFEQPKFTRRLGADTVIESALLSRATRGLVGQGLQAKPRRGAIRSYNPNADLRAAVATPTPILVATSRAHFPAAFSRSKAVGPSLSLAASSAAAISPTARS